MCRDTTPNALRYGSQCGRQGLGHDTILYRDRGDPLGRDTASSSATIPRVRERHGQPAHATRPNARHRVLYRDTNFVSRRVGGGGDTVCPDIATQQDTTYDMAGWGHDTAPNAPLHGAVRAAWVQGVHLVHSTQF